MTDGGGAAGSSRLTGHALVAAGVLTLAYALWTPRLHDASGFPDSLAALAVAGALALVVLGRSAGGPWQTAGRWIALAMVGWGAHLQLIEAGNAVAYQHLRFTPSVLWGVLAAQAVVVGVSIVRLEVRVAEVLRAWVPWLGVILAVLFLWSTAAVPSQDPGYFILEITVTLLLQVVHLGTIVLAALSVPTGELDRAAAWLDAPGPEKGFDRVAWLGAAWVTVASAVLCVVVYGNHPHVPDEFVYLMPARYLAEGMLALPAPPEGGAFDIDLMTNDGTRWYSPVPPGWPAVLAIGMRFGVPWLVNPVLGGLTVLGTSKLLRSLYDDRTSRIGTILLAASPWMLFLSMSFMTHMMTLVCGLAAALAVDAAFRRRAAWPALLGGAAIGWAGLTRPLDAVAIAGVIGIWSLGARASWFRFGPTLFLAAGAAAIGSLVFPYNTHFTGSPTTFPLMAYTDATYGAGTNALGFGANRGLGWTGLDPFPGHGAIDVVVNAMLNLSAINIELLGWGAGSLLGIAFFVFARKRAADWGMILASGFVLFLHSFYWFSGGPDFGGRYWFLVLIPWIALSARAVVSFDESRSRADPATEPASAGSRGTARGVRGAVGALALCLVATAVFVPWRAFDKYHHYRNMQPGVLALAAEHDFGADLIMVRGDRHPDYASAAIYNPLDWFGEAPVYAWDQDEEARRTALAEYSGRRVWLVDGPTVTGGGFELRAGPLSTDSAAALPWR